MVTVIHSGSSLRNAVNYNEQKAKLGKATCLLAVNYPKDPADLTFFQKLQRLTNQAELNHRTTVNSVHISLNFDPSEKLPHQQLEQIAHSYMDRIGFGEQPYLVYEHRDAGHPHIHIVTTNIKSDGKRISLHNLGKNQSEKARKAVEKEFGLVQADQKKLREEKSLKLPTVKKVVYGQVETKQAIASVLGAVLNAYKFKSLEELNAVLLPFNIRATRGTKVSRTYQRQGLLFQVLDEKGSPVGVPIKASLFPGKPTLTKLEKIFERNKINQTSDEKRVKLVIDLFFLKSRQPSLGGLKAALEKEGIAMIEYRSADGRLFGMTYVDHKTKAVMKASDLGKAYAPKGIDGRIKGEKEVVQEAKPTKQRPKLLEGPMARPDDVAAPEKPSKSLAGAFSDSGPIAAGEPQIERPAGLPYELQQNFKKKRKRRRPRL